MERKNRAHRPESRSYLRGREQSFRSQGRSERPAVEARLEWAAREGDGSVVVALSRTEEHCRPAGRRRRRIVAAVDVLLRNRDEVRMRAPLFIVTALERGGRKRPAGRIIPVGNDDAKEGADRFRAQDS